MTGASEFLFSYGTLQLESVQTSSFGRILKGKADSMVGFKQDMIEIKDEDVIRKSGERFHQVVVESSDPEDEVKGTVFEISKEELDAADRYEVSDYRRISVTLKSGQEAWVYVRAD
ncbi:gamma-glutamylcyclotransferase [Acetobacter sp. AN02]|uniref:gamma-glutamylcyclotransferase family protein n=1 Tax=Acetobacter sp. AN02 TaxID=2894186 RepID=UPI0024342A74|nr:gamma-glutamylcyclotransferase [Acetobacter sp. AN02]MDG6095508.1 gamma-glutamylcyclotransferase [Acetobacter sp. AN02]